jgi:hypothetical protein
VEAVENDVKGTDTTEGASVAEGTGFTALRIVEGGGEQGEAKDDASAMAAWSKELNGFLGEGKMIDLEVTPIDESTVVWLVVYAESPGGVRTCTVASHGSGSVKLTLDLLDLFEDV